MSAADATTPRVFVIRHGETEWSKNGRYTGLTDLALLPEGEEKVRKTSSVIYGPSKLIDPRKIVQVILSPRQRATRTWDIFGEKDRVPQERRDGVRMVSEELREWEYGDYEGLTTDEIEETRRTKGLDRDRKWDIWRDGCEGGESPADVTRRLDKIIEVITKIQGQAMKAQQPGDIVMVSHGHLSRAFVKRWLGLPLDSELNMMLEPGGVCGLSYSHGTINERAVLVGMSFPS